MQVLLCGCDAAVTESLLDDLKVRSTGQEPGCVSVPQTMRRQMEIETGGSKCLGPDVAPEPVTADMAIGVDNSGRSRIVFPGRAPLRPIGSNSVLAVPASAFARSVCSWRAVWVGVALLIGLRSSERCRVWKYLRDPPTRTFRLTEFE